MLPLGLFRSADFTGANALTLFLYGALGCLFFFLPLDLIQVQGYTRRSRRERRYLPVIVILFFFSRWSGGLVARYGARRPLLVGPALAAMGFFLLGLPGYREQLLDHVRSRNGRARNRMAVSIAPLTTTVMNSVGEESAGSRRHQQRGLARRGTSFDRATSGSCSPASSGRSSSGGCGELSWIRVQPGRS
jgi:hypothetical protein